VRLDFSTGKRDTSKLQFEHHGSKEDRKSKSKKFEVRQSQKPYPEFKVELVERKGPREQKRDCDCKLF